MRLSWGAPGLSGVILAFAFLPVPLGFLAWGALVPLLGALQRALNRGEPMRAFWGIGYRFGLVFFLASAHWIARLSDVAITVSWLKYPAWLAAGAYLALFPAVTCTLTAWITRRSRASLAFTFPCVFLLVEQLRGAGELGFPWFQPGYSQHAYTPVIQLASIGGIGLVTSWVLAVNAMIWRVLPERISGIGPPASRRLFAAGLGLLILFPWIYGGRVLATPSLRITPEHRVALVQGNIPGEIKWSGRHQGEILASFLHLSEQAASQSPPPMMILWPETATGSYLRRQVDQTIAVARFVDRVRVPVFSGFPDIQIDEDGLPKPINAAGLFLPGGDLSAVYAKRHLVPFGERMPFQSLLPWMGRVQLGQAEWAAGDREASMPSAAGPFSCLICFEAIFPDLARGDVRKGAKWLVNITNDEWFGHSAALYQHAAMAVFRAVENHVALARCANTGLTLVADPYGRVLARHPVLQSGVLSAPLPPPGPTTLYNRVGDWPWVLAAVALSILLLAGALTRARAL